jgi:cobalt/nickel transport system permease protein
MDERAGMDSPVHRLDARAKALVTLVFIVTVMSFGRYELSALAPFALYPVALGAAARIPARDVLRKLLVAAPFAVAVGLLNPVFDRAPVMLAGRLTVSAGWVSFASILARAALTVSAALVLVACTGMNRLGAGLRHLGVPRLFVVQLLFLYRYLFVVADEALTLRRGMELRLAGARAPGLGAYAGMTGTLLLRSIDRAERIYRAMLARGFDGEVRVLRPTRFGAADWAFLAGWTAYFAAARGWNLSAGLGRLLTGGLGG